MAKTVAECKRGLLQMAESAPQPDHDHEIKLIKTNHDHVVRLNPGTIWKLVDTDRTLLTARAWGIHRETLYAYVRDIGFPLVREAIDKTGQLPWVKNKAAYTCSILKQRRA